MDWFLDGVDAGATKSWQIGDLLIHQVHLQVSRTGTTSQVSNIVSGKSGTW